MENWSSPRYNIPTILVAALVSLFAVANADYSDGRGMAILVLIWLPIVVAAVTFLLYLLLLRFAPKFAWIPTLLGVAFLLLLTVGALRG